MELRPYQVEAVESVFREWESGNRRTLLSMATGCGKTICFAEIVKKVAASGGRSLILAHRGELLEQAADKIQRTSGLESALEKAESTSLNSWVRVTVGSVQTLMRQDRLNAFAPDRFDAIIVDEAHHTLAEGYIRILDHFKSARVLGVTATADRADKKDLGEVYDSIAYEYGIAQAINDGYLCPIEAEMVPLELDVSSVSVTHGDYQAGQLGDALEPYLDAIADAMVTRCQDRRTVVFLPLVRTAKAFAEKLNERGLIACEVDGQSEDREEILSDFNRGKYQVLCNSMLLTEGWDCPAVDCIVCLRPTKSRGLYCLDEQTEVLTRDGWKHDVEVGEEVLAFNTKTEETRFVPALAKVRRPLDDDEFFCSINGQSTDIRITNHHRMIYDDKRRKGWKIKEAQNLADMRDGAYIPVCGNGKFTGVPLSDADLTFIGWVMTDGSINKANGQITITQGEQQKSYCEEIERCIKECGFKFTRSVRKRTDIHWNAHGNCVIWTISHGKPRATDKDKTGWGRLEPWLSKDMSKKLYDMTQRQFAVMLEAIFHGDGNKSNTLIYDIGKGNKTFIERLQAMAIQRGYRASVSVEKANEVRKCDLWHIHVKKQGFVKVGSISGQHAQWTKEQHTNESCWCVENELGTLVTRRNGKIAVVGNCQMVGRGTRLSPETGKEKLLLLDFLWMTGRHNLVRPAALFATSDDVAKRITEMTQEIEGAVDLMGAEPIAEQDVALEREAALAAELARMRKRKAKFVDPLQYAISICDLDLQTFEPAFEWEERPITKKQTEQLEKLGIDPEGITQGYAELVLAKARKRIDAHLATPKQVRMLERKGFQHPGLWTFEQASHMMSRLAMNRWIVPRDIDPATYDPNN